MFLKLLIVSFRKHDVSVLHIKIIDYWVTLRELRLLRDVNVSLARAESLSARAAQSRAQTYRRDHVTPGGHGQRAVPPHLSLGWVFLSRCPSLRSARGWSLCHSPGLVCCRGIQDVEKFNIQYLQKVFARGSIFIFYVHIKTNPSFQVNNVYCRLHYITSHLADAFIQSDLQKVHSTMRVQTQNNKNQESTIFFKKAKLQSAISKCHISGTQALLNLIIFLFKV